LQGALFGLSLRHSRADIARSFLEGVFFEIKRCIEVLAETAPVDAVMVSGNLVHSPASTQMLSDILHRAVGTVPDKSPAAIGAAMLARRRRGYGSRMPRLRCGAGRWRRYRSVRPRAGGNGHVAFNEPGSPWDLGTHVVHLSLATRAAHERQAQTPWRIPARGVTMGIKTLLQSRHVLLLIAGERKEAARAAVYAAGVADVSWPVTSLLTHADLTVIELCAPAERR